MLYIDFGVAFAVFVKQGNGWLGADCADLVWCRFGWRIGGLCSFGLMQICLCRMIGCAAAMVWGGLCRLIGRAAAMVWGRLRRLSGSAAAMVTWECCCHG
ncbi:hypothetical protein U1Q18_002127 [Sarracenia purpurea var. burkii]